MTRDEAIRILFSIDNADEMDEEFAEAYNMAIQALKQEPCEDAISRQAVLAIAGDSCLDLDDYESTEEFCKEIDDLPPVYTGCACIGNFSKAKQDSILDEIKADIGMYEANCRLQGDKDECEKCNSNVFGSIYRIIDKYKAAEELRMEKHTDRLIEFAKDHDKMIEEVEG